MPNFLFPSDPDLPDAEMLSAVRGRLDAARAALPALADAEIDAVLRVVSGKRAVLAGQWQGRAAVFRLVPPSAVHAQTREWREATRLWPHMKNTRYRVAEPFAHLPAVGAMVVEHVEGTPMLKHMWRSPPETRPAHLRDAAIWLRHHTDVTESWGMANPAGWLARAARAARTQPHDALQEIETAILGDLGHLADGLDGTEWRTAICHGDFHPNNLILGPDRLTGIDLGGSSRLPVCKDIARFLVHLARRGMLPSGRRLFGVDAGGLEVFAEIFSLTATEREWTLPFFIGIEALIRVEHPAMSCDRLWHARKMQAALHSDLAAVPR